MSHPPQLRITTSNRSALRCTSFRFGVGYILANGFAYLLRADARSFGILEVRAPRRVADKLTGTPDNSQTTYKRT